MPEVSSMPWPAGRATWEDPPESNSPGTETLYDSTFSSVWSAPRTTMFTAPGSLGSIDAPEASALPNAKGRSAYEGSARAADEGDRRERGEAAREDGERMRERECARSSLSATAGREAGSMSPIRSDAVPLIEENIATRAGKENARARVRARDGERRRDSGCCDKMKKGREIYKHS